MLFYGLNVMDDLLLEWKKWFDLVVWEENRVKDVSVSNLSWGWLKDV